MTRRNDPLGSIGWTERTGGVLTTRECVDDLLTPVVRNHSHRAYARAAAIAARRGISFDRGLLYLAAMFHDAGLPRPVPRDRARYLHRFAVTDLSVRMAPFS